MSPLTPNEAQQIRDACGLGTSCAACGHPGTARDPLVLAADGFRVHVSHVSTEGDGYYGVPFSQDPAWVTEIGYPEPERGPLQVLRSPQAVTA